MAKSGLRKSVKAKPAQSHASYVVPGLAASPDGSQYQVNTYDVDASPNVFVANEFRLKRRAHDILIQFGSVDDFEENGEYFDLAIQLEMPLQHVAKSLVELVWDRPSRLRNHPIIRDIELALSDEARAWAKEYMCTRSVSKEPSVRSTTFRKFPISIATVTWSEARGYIEFFEIPASALIAIQTGIARKQEGVRSILTVVLEARILYAFLNAVKQLMPDYMDVQGKIDEEDD
jgi:hypothetical protein